MGVTVLNILFAGAGLLLGALLGRRFRKVERPAEISLTPEPVEPEETNQQQLEATEEVEKPSQPVEQESQPTDLVQEMMVRLQELTQSVRLDVGVHNTQIQEISEELTSVDATEAEVISVVEKLVRANEAMQAQLDSAEERLEEQSREMEAHVREARTDALTSLFNRRAFGDEMLEAEKQLRESNQPTCVLMIDVDHFKKFNDTYGHQGGDEVLKGVASVLRQNLTENEIVCRYGGEEFAVIFSGSQLEAARIRGEQARTAIGKETFHFDGMDLRVSASAGLAQLLPAETTAALVRRADESLYLCKKLGRDCGHWHDGQQSHPMSESAEGLSTDLKPTSEQDEAATAERFAGISDPVSFRQDIERRIAELKRGGSPISLLVVEVDNYAVLLNEFGKGTEVTTATAQFLRGTMREMDHIARLKDSQFALLLPGARIDAACEVAERIRSAAERCELQFTVSLAAVEATGQDDTQDLVDRAERSLDWAMEVGGNCTFIGEANGEFNRFTADEDFESALASEEHVNTGPSS